MPVHIRTALKSMTARVRVRAPALACGPPCALLCAAIVLALAGCSAKPLATAPDRGSTTARSAAQHSAVSLDQGDGAVYLPGARSVSSAPHPPVAKLCAATKSNPFFAARKCF